MMEKNDKEISPGESIQLIESMINRAKDRFNENGHLYLLWGWTVLICSIGHFILLKYVRYEKHYLIWMLTWIVAIYQIIYLAKRKKKEKVKTYSEDILGYVWLTFIVSMFLIGFVFMRGQAEYYYKLINPVFLILYGIPTFLSGIILRFKPLKAGGISCWVLSVLSTFIPYEYQLLMLSIAMLAAWIVPGYMLRAKYINQ